MKDVLIPLFIFKLTYHSSSRKMTELQKFYFPYYSSSRSYLDAPCYRKSVITVLSRKPLHDQMQLEKGGTLCGGDKHTQYRPTLFYIFVLKSFTILYVTLQMHAELRSKILSYNKNKWNFLFLLLWNVVFFSCVTLRDIWQSKISKYGNIGEKNCIS